MQIQVDSREKPRAIKSILAEFERQEVGYFISKLYVGDYMNTANTSLVVDRKQNLFELCSNVCQDHERFRRELIRAQEHGIHIIFLCEHGQGIRCMEDIIWWDNPRRHFRQRDPETGSWIEVETKATSGDTLFKILRTLERKYGCEFMFCDKKETGDRIIRILSET
ncbi:MAG: ERCC4 domain-containing protein [Bacteroidales bacterium]|nr:ERCC4 domain-containing protein [Bacteroidales bacterium]